MDISLTNSITVLADMHKLPFEQESFSEVLMDNVLEHSENTTEVLHEVFKILRPGGLLYIFVPYYNSHGAFMDPTHKSFFSERTFDYYSNDPEIDHYADFEFEIIKTTFFYSKLLKIVPFQSWKLKLGKMIGDLVLSMKVILRKPGEAQIEPSIEGWKQD